MPNRHGANESILFAPILDPYKVTPSEFAQINDGLFAHVYKTLGRVYMEQIKQCLFEQIRLGLFIRIKNLSN